MKEINKNNYAILMAGGVGSRFWPVSTGNHPKQFRDLLGTGETLIQTTFKRLSALVPEENIFILTNERYDKLVREQLPGIGDDQVVLEPVMRNTAPAVLLAALKIHKRNPDAVMIMAPSDHWIEDESAFSKDIQLAFETCRTSDKIITLGIQPSFPNTGYGYIHYGETAHQVKAVKEFTEKPSYAIAQKFLNSGDYLWNAGIFVWNVDFILRSFEKNLPKMFALLQQGRDQLNSDQESIFIRSTYPLVEDISIDYGILEKEEHIFVIKASFDWNDLGTWGSLYNEVEKDNQENAVMNARLVAEDSSGNIVSTYKDKVVVLEGLQNFIIVDEEEVLLLVPKEKEQDIKQIRARVQKEFGENLG